MPKHRASSFVNSRCWITVFICTGCVFTSAHAVITTILASNRSNGILLKKTGLTQRTNFVDIQTVLSAPP